MNYDYDFSEVTPETCDVWYVEVDYTSDTVGNITTIMSYMINLDPETSRGTKTASNKVKQYNLLKVYSLINQSFKLNVCF